MNKLIEFANANPLLVAGTLLMALAVIFNEMRLKRQGLTALSAAQAVRLINQGATIVDIRDQAHFDAGHIVDAINVPATDLAGDATIRVKKNRPVLVVCDTGAQSSKCAANLRAAGYETVFSLEGGLSAWQRDNLPLVGSGG